MTCFLLAFLLTSALWLFLIWLAARRVIGGLKNNEAAQKAVLLHILSPIFGDKERPKEDKPCE